MRNFSPSIQNWGRIRRQEKGLLKAIRWKYSFYLKLNMTLNTLLFQWVCFGWSTISPAFAQLPTKQGHSDLYCSLISIWFPTKCHPTCFSDQSRFYKNRRDAWPPMLLSRWSQHWPRKKIKQCAQDSRILLHYQVTKCQLDLQGCQAETLRNGVEIQL